MKFETQDAKVQYIRGEVGRFGDGFFPTTQHMQHLDHVTDSLPFNQFTDLQQRVAALRIHIEAEKCALLS